MALNKGYQKYYSLRAYTKCMPMRLNVIFGLSKGRVTEWSKI